MPRQYSCDQCYILYLEEPVSTEFLLQFDEQPLYQLTCDKGEWTNNIVVEYNFFHSNNRSRTVLFRHNRDSATVFCCPKLLSDTPTAPTVTALHLTAVCYQNSLCVMYMNMNPDAREMIACVA